MSYSFCVTHQPSPSCSGKLTGPAQLHNFSVASVIHSGLLRVLLAVHKADVCTRHQTISTGQMSPDFNWFCIRCWFLFTEYSGLVSVCIINHNFSSVYNQTIKMCSRLEVWPCASSSVVESCKTQVTSAVFNEWRMDFSFFPHWFWWNINLGLIVLNKFIQLMYLRALLLCKIIGAIGQTYFSV